MLSDIPPALQERIVSYLLANKLEAAKALYDEWLKTHQPVKDLSGE